MKTAFLYCTTTTNGRKSEDRFVKEVRVTDEVFEAVARNYRNSWCAENGFPTTATHYHHLRDRKRIEITATERARIQADYLTLKRSGKIPSAFGVISAKLARK